MNIIGYRLGRLRVPLTVPFRTALREVDAIDDWVLRLDTDAGAVGYGSAAATAMITGETHASIEAALRLHLLPAVLGGSIADLPGLLARLGRAMAGNPSAKAAVDIALHDLAAQAAGLPLHRFLGSGREGPQHLATDLTISANPLAEMRRDVDRALDAGYTALKIKLGKHPDDDLATVTALHAQVAGRATLRLDANQGWSLAQAIAVMQGLEAGGVRAELLEQPLLADDLEGLATLRAAIATPLLVDESVFHAGDARRVLGLGAADLINLKLMKSGGLAGASKVAEVARAAGVPCMVGCMLESSIGAAAAAHFALAKADVVHFLDLDSPGLARFDPVEGNTRFDGPWLRVGDTPGLGIRAIAGLDAMAP